MISMGWVPNLPWKLMVKSQIHWYRLRNRTLLQSKKFKPVEIQDRLKGRGSPKVQWHTDLVPMVLVKQVPPMCQGFWNSKMVLCSDFFWSLTSGLYQLLSSDCFVQLDMLSHPIKFDERTQWLIIEGRQHLKTIFCVVKIWFIFTYWGMILSPYY